MGEDEEKKEEEVKKESARMTRKIKMNKQRWHKKAK